MYSKHSQRAHTTHDFCMNSDRANDKLNTFKKNSFLLLKMHFVNLHKPHYEVKEQFKQEAAKMSQA